MKIAEYQTVNGEIIVNYRELTDEEVAELTAEEESEPTLEQEIEALKAQIAELQALQKN